MSAKKPRKRAYIPPSHEVINRKATATRSSRTSNATKAQRQNPRGAHVYPTPSLKRTAKRLPIYFLLIFGLQLFLLRDARAELSTQQLVLFAAGQAGIVTIIFAPFMHMMDRFAYNRWQKRQEKHRAR